METNRVLAAEVRHSGCTSTETGTQLKSSNVAPWDLALTTCYWKAYCEISLPNVFNDRYKTLLEIVFARISGFAIFAFRLAHVAHTSIAVDLARAPL